MPVNPFGANGWRFAVLMCVAPTAMNRPSASSLITTTMLLAVTLSFTPCSSSTLISMTIANAGTWITMGMPAMCRSEEHTSELQSHHDLVCRLLLEKKKPNDKLHIKHYAPLANLQRICPCSTAYSYPYTHP